jgi:ribosomal protein L16 Arg81 hydroxylase
LNIEDVLTPLVPSQFLEQVWNQKPFVIRGHKSKLDTLPDSGALPSMCAGSVDQFWSQTQNFSAQATGTNSTGKIVHLNEVPISMYPQLFNSGYSLCFRDVSKTDKALDQLTLSARDFGSCSSAVSITCYLSPPSSNGILHYDSQHVFFMQREGEKHWRIAERPAIENPLENFIYPNASAEYFDSMKVRGYEIKLPIDCGYQDIVLETGDVLYLPPGYYHVQHTKTLRSFHYTLTLEPTSPRLLFLKELQDIVLRNSTSLNCDIRSFTGEQRDDFLDEQLSKLKELICEISLDDLNHQITKGG